MSVVPTKIELAGERELRITWSDGQVRRSRFQEFLDNCPCAGCRERRNQAVEAPKEVGLLPVLSPEEIQPLKLVSMQPVGSYAYNIHFNHGCRQGIFTFDLLRKLGREE